jgi:hypothetical protein
MAQDKRGASIERVTVLFLPVPRLPASCFLRHPLRNVEGIKSLERSKSTVLKSMDDNDNPRQKLEPSPSLFCFLLERELMSLGRRER